MAVTCAGLGDFQAKPSCETKLAAAGAGLELTEASCGLLERTEEVVKHEPRPAILMEKSQLTAWVGP